MEKARVVFVICPNQFKLHRSRAPLIRYVILLDEQDPPSGSWLRISPEEGLRLFFSHQDDLEVMFLACDMCKARAETPNIQ